MAAVRKSVIVPHSCATMYALVEDCERYPEFLPWCSGAHVFERGEHTMRARLDINYHGLRTHIATFNKRDPPSRLTLEFVEGPFERFHAEWRFAPLGEEGCRVEFLVDYAFSSHALERLLGPVFGYIADTLVERFVHRAETRAGDPSP